MAEMQNRKSRVAFTIFTYTGRSVTVANTLRKNGFYDFPIVFVQPDLLSKNLTENWVICRKRRKRSGDPTGFLVILSFN